MRQAFIIAAIVGAAGVAGAGELNVNQRLIVACHRIDVDGVVAALRDGADVNARFRAGNTRLFQDPWSLGWPLSGEAWTPLIALASASKYPNPPRKVQNTITDLNWARDQQKKIPADQLDRRRRDSLTILLILLSHKPDIDADDGYGATALYQAVDEDKPDVVKQLIRFGANVNTKTATYIDGPGDLTPLHEACQSVELTKLLLDKGADPKAKDTDGKTPLDWAKTLGDPAVVRLYESR